MKTDEANLKREELASLVANWRAEFNLDASKLDDSQFTLFLEATGSSGYKELCDLKDDQFQAFERIASEQNRWRE